MPGSLVSGAGMSADSLVSGVASASGGSLVSGSASASGGSLVSGVSAQAPSEPTREQAGREVGSLLQGAFGAGRARK